MKRRDLPAVGGTAHAGGNAGVDHAGAQSGSGGVHAAAGHHGDTGDQAAGFSRIGGDIADDVGGVVQLRELVGVHAALLDHVFVPTEFVELIEGGIQAAGAVIGHELAGELELDVSGRVEELKGFGVNFGLVAGHPHALVAGVVSVDLVAGNAEDFLGANVLFYPVALLESAAVAVQQAVAQRVAVAVNGQGVGAQAADADAGDVGGVDVGVLDDLLADGLELAPVNDVGVLLSPVGAGVFHVVHGGSRSEDLARKVEDHTLAARSTDVVTQQEFFAHLLVSSSLVSV